MVISLSDVGAKGDFQVGALRYIYDQGVRLDILSATSVGSANAIKPTESEDLAHQDVAWAAWRLSGRD